MSRLDLSSIPVLTGTGYPEAFAEAVRTLLSNAELARTLSERARGLARRFPLDGMIDAYEGLIAECLATPLRP